VVSTEECGPAAADVPAVPDSETALESLLEGTQLVLHATDAAMVERARLLDRLCAERGIGLAQVLVIDGHAWMTSRLADSWTAGWRRAEAWRAGRARESTVRPSPVAAIAVANQLVHGIFQSITQPETPDRGRLVRVDLSSLDSAVAGYLAHPYAAAVEPATDIVDRIEQLQAGERMTAEQFSQRAAACVGDLAGVFGDPVEREFAQLPLHVCAIDVADPVGLLDPGSPAATVTGAGLDFATARWQAARRAFAVYSSLMIDPRRLTPDAAGAFDSSRDPDELLSAVRRGSGTGLPGYALADGSRQVVDARQVFPALSAAGRPYSPPIGVGVGYDWDEAVTAGLVGHCRRLTIQEMTAARTPFPLVDLAGADLDGRGERYRALLAATGQTVAIYDVTGRLGMPTMIGCLGSVSAGCASSLSRADALADTLEQLLLHHQAQSNGQHEYAPPSAPSIPSELRGTGEVSAAAPDTTAAAVIAALVANGHRPVAVPLDHDPEVNAVMPYTVHVVMSDG
jgi:hypothetical protein